MSPVPQDRFPGCRELMLAILNSQGLGIGRTDGKPCIVPADETISDPIPNPFGSSSGFHKTPSGYQAAPSGMRRPPSGLQSPPSGFLKPPSGAFKPPSGPFKPPM